MAAKTVSAAMDLLADATKTTKTESALAKSHRASIEAVLKRDFAITNFFKTGSFGNGTNVSGYSDVDYFAVIPRDNLKSDSSLTLTSVADTLRDRFPNTGVRINGPAIRVPFGLNGSETTEVVPADATGLTALGFRQFDIPDGDGGWMFSAPESHDAYVTRTDNDLKNQVKPLIRLVKLWKFIRSVPIKSFYLEMWITSYARGESVIVYSIDIERIFERLLASKLPPIIDPRFPNDGRYLFPTNTDIQHTDALSAVRNAAAWAKSAREFELAGDPESAFFYWDKLFKDQFPAYG